VGRPSKYEPARVARLLDAIGAGSSLRVACGYAGISEDTLAAWRGRYPDFEVAVREAEDKVELRMAGVWAQAAFGWRDPDRTLTDGLVVPGRVHDPDWRAARDWLRCRRPGDWRMRTEVTGPEGGPVPVHGDVVVYHLPDNGRGDATPPKTPGATRASAATNGHAATNGGGRR
jgi:hypothetical protein